MMFGPFTLPTSRYGFTNFGSYAFFEHLNSTTEQAGIFIMNTNGGRLRLRREGDWMDVGMASRGESGTFSVDWYGPPSQGVALAASLRERYHAV